MHLFILDLVSAVACAFTAAVFLRLARDELRKGSRWAYVAECASAIFAATCIIRLVP